MRYYAIFLALSMMLPWAAWAQKQMYAIPVQKDVPVYQNEIRKLYEKPLFVMEEQGRYFIKETGKNAVKIQDREGSAGWVELRRIKMVSENKSFSYDPAVIESWLDNPQLTAIIDGNDPKANPLILDRSFADALKENVDKETIFRQATSQ
jgi:hypothetical protein